MAVPKKKKSQNLSAKKKGVFIFNKIYKIKNKNKILQLSKRFFFIKEKKI